VSYGRVLAPAMVGLCLTSAAIMLGNGIRVGSLVEIHAHREAKDGRTYIFNTPTRVCRYLYASGVEERRTVRDEAGTPCAFFGSS
jgi:hypothetical protein